MCGICGSTSSASREEVQTMNDVQAHRGPDDEGTYTDPLGRLSLGARRLSIIDLERGHQPLCNEDGTIWAVLNGEIYNSPALQERLRLRGHRFASRADTETLVHLYEEYREDMVHALAGMFAFAIWDERRGRLLLGRDRFGEKPLFVRRGDRGLCFASELSALVQIAGAQARPRSRLRRHVHGSRLRARAAHDRSGHRAASPGPGVDVGRRGRHSRRPPILVGESLSDGGTGSGA